MLAKSADTLLIPAKSSEDVRSSPMFDVLTDTDESEVRSSGIFPKSENFGKLRKVSDQCRSMSRGIVV